MGYHRGMSKTNKPRNPDHVRRTNRPSPDNAVITERLKSLVTPAVLCARAYYRSLGLRDRILSLPVMVAALLLLLWRQVPSVCELGRLLGHEDLFWTPKITVSQQALSQRCLVFPAEIMQRFLLDLLPTLRTRWATRQRPLPEVVVCAQKTFGRDLRRGRFDLGGAVLQTQCQCQGLAGRLARPSGRQDLHGDRFGHPPARADLVYGSWCKPMTRSSRTRFWRSPRRRRSGFLTAVF